MGMRARGGDEALFQCLHCARETYRSRLPERADIDQLASLFTECVIAETQPIKVELSSNYTVGATVQSGNCGNSILNADAHSIVAETGRAQVMLNAFSDGSSLCLKCGDLVNYHRKDEHNAFWCQN